MHTRTHVSLKCYQPGPASTRPQLIFNSLHLCLCQTRDVSSDHVWVVTSLYQTNLQWLGDMKLPPLGCESLWQEGSSTLPLLHFFRLCPLLCEWASVQQLLGFTNHKLTLCHDESLQPYIPHTWSHWPTAFVALARLNIRSVNVEGTVPLLTYSTGHFHLQQHLQIIFVRARLLLLLHFFLYLFLFWLQRTNVVQENEKLALSTQHGHVC